MSASRAFSGKSAEPIVTEPGALGSFDFAADGGGLPPTEVVVPPAGGCETAELPLLPQAASASSPTIARTAE